MKLTVEVVVKPVPVITSVVAPLPATWTPGVRAEITGVTTGADTVKLVALVPVPAAVVTAIRPLVAPVAVR